MVSSLGLFGIALVALIVSSRFIIKSLTTITIAFGVSEFVVAFILLAIATTVPELFVSVASAVHNAGDLVIATAFGSMIIHITFMVGASAFLSAGITTAGLHLRRDILIGSMITVLPIVFLRDAIVSRLEGGILVAAFCFYMYLVARDQRLFGIERMPRRLFQGVVHIAIVGILMVVLILSANLTVDAAVDLATVWKIPSYLIGLFLLAFGTSLPEMIATLQAALQRKPGFALGTIIGTNIADAGLVIGIASLIKPLEVPLTHSVVMTAIFVVFSLFVLSIFAMTKKKLSMPEGAFLTMLFFVFGLIMVALNVVDG